MSRPAEQWETLVFWLTRNGFGQQAIQLMGSESPSVPSGTVRTSLYFEWHLNQFLTYLIIIHCFN